MGVFKKKNSAVDEAIERAERVFDESFRNELRNHGRMYFEKVINESASLFKTDLDATIVQISNDLKQHVTTQLDERFAEYSRSMKEAQDLALQSLNRNAQALEAQQKELNAALLKTIADQETLLTNASNETASRSAIIQSAQNLALRTLNSNIQALQLQQQQISETLQKNIATQEDVVIKAFEGNMAKIVEHYLLGALGDQYDLKTQLPSIIKQLEANKEAMVEDMKL